MTNETPATGHNSAGAGKLLQTIISRYENIDAERDELSADLKEIMSEAKSHGFDVKIVRKVLARRKRDREEVKNEDEMISLYEDQIGAFG